MNPHWLTAAMLAALLGTTACASAPDNFGRAQAEARTRQIENPGAGETPVPVEGLAPGTSEDVLKNYHRNQDTNTQEQRQQRLRRDGVGNVTGQ